MSEKKNKVVLVKTIILVVIILLIGLVIWLLINRSESYTSDSTTRSEYSALTCTSSHPEDAFFISEASQSFSHTMKILFTDDSMKEVSYRYDATYNSSTMAEKNKVKLHADYNKYMGASNLNSESLNPVFSMDKSKIIISLYAEAKKINNVVARLFFIDEEEFTKLEKFTSKDYKKLYESKGFTCKISK